MNCYSCGAELKPDVINLETNYQFENALWVGFFGGYGMFVDDIDSAPSTLEGAAHEAVICHECAHKLCDNNPWIERLIQPLKSHSHRREFWEANPTHEGWDKPKTL